MPAFQSEFSYFSIKKSGPGQEEALALLDPLPCYLPISSSCLLLSRTTDPAQTEAIVSRQHRLITDIFPRSLSALVSANG